MRHKIFNSTGIRTALLVSAVIFSGIGSAEASPPSADFTWTAGGLSVYFQDLSSGDPDSWLWDFGDGQALSRQNPLHTYGSPGTYVVTLTASNAFGSSERVQVVTVSDGEGDAPKADFTWSVNGLDVEFTDRSIGQVDSWQWEFGDGGFSAEQHPTYNFDAEGVYDVSLRVANAYGYSVRIVEVTVGGTEAPNADFRWTSSGDTVTFLDRSTGTVASWQWEFGDGNCSIQPEPVYTFSAAGTYDVTLMVANEYGSSSRTYEVSVEGATGGEPPLSDFRWREGNSLSVYFEDMSIGQVETRQWTFGDGDYSSEENPFKIYMEAGVYEVSLTVGNRYGQTTRTQQVEVGETGGGGDPPRADFEWGVDGTAVNFEDTSLGEVTGWQWTFGDGSESSEQSPSHTYAGSGTYTVELEVSNGWGSSSRAVDVVIETPDNGWLQFISGASLAAGAEGSFWVTSLDINNTSSQLMTYSLLWLPRGQDNSNPTESASFTLGAGQSKRFDNVLDEAFGFTAEESPNGAVAIAASTSEYLSLARIFNQPEAGDGGTVGQALQGVPYNLLVGQGDKQRLIFMTEDDEFRANIACQNGAMKSIEVKMAIFNDRGQQLGETGLILPPISNKQINRVLEPFAPVNGYVDIWSETPDSMFYCFGSVLDNITSDPTTVLTK